MSFLNDLVNVVINNEGDFFTSGLRTAINNYNETKKLFTGLTFVILGVAVLSLFIRSFLW